MPFYRIKFDKEAINTLRGNDEAEFNAYLDVWARDNEAAENEARGHIMISSNIDEEGNTRLHNAIEVAAQHQQKQYYTIIELIEEEVPPAKWRWINERTTNYPAEIICRGDLIRQKNEK